MLEAGGGGAPVTIHFDEELEEDLLLEKVLDILAGLGADALEGGTGFADENTLLGIALAVYDGRDTDDVFFFKEGLYFYFDRVRNLFVVVEEDLLTDDLIYKETLGLVGELVLGEESRSFGQGILDGIEELGYAEPLLRRDGEDLRFGQLGMPESDEVLQGFLGREVNLIYYKEHAYARGCHFLHFLEEIGIALGVILYLGDIKKDVSINQRRTGELEHLTLELVVRAEDTGRVGIDHLEVLTVDDAHDTMTGGLRLRGDDRETLAYQGVHEGRFADIRVSNYIYKAAFVHYFLIFAFTHFRIFILPL